MPSRVSAISVFTILHGAGNALALVTASCRSSRSFAGLVDAGGGAGGYGGAADGAVVEG